MAYIKVRYDNPELTEPEALSRALSVFTNRVKNEGILDTYKEKQFYTKPSVKLTEKKKRKKFLSKINKNKWR